MVKKKNPNKNVKFYDESFLSAKIGVERRDFHRRIKPIILSDFDSELKRENISNPDIGLDEDGNIWLGNISHTKLIETNVSISLYI